MSDNLVNVKTAIWDFVVDTLTSTSNGFQDEFLTPNAQIYWEWTRSKGRSIFPYVFLEIESDEALGYATFSSYETRLIDDVLKIYRIDKEHHFVTVGFDFNSMPTSDNTLSGFDAQNQAQSLARLIRRKLKSDESISWFGNCGNDAGINIGSNTEDMSDLLYLPDYEDTKVKHRFRFSCPFNWQDTYETEVSLADGIYIDEINGESVDIEIINDYSFIITHNDDEFIVDHDGNYIITQ